MPAENSISSPSSRALLLRPEQRSRRRCRWHACCAFANQAVRSCGRAICSCDRGRETAGGALPPAFLGLPISFCISARSLFRSSVDESAAAAAGSAVRLSPPKSSAGIAWRKRPSRLPRVSPAADPERRPGSSRRAAAMPLPQCRCRDPLRNINATSRTVRECLALILVASIARLRGVREPNSTPRQSLAETTPDPQEGRINQTLPPRFIRYCRASRYAHSRVRPHRRVSDLPRAERAMITVSF